MKKYYPLLLAILVAFSSIFVSCDEDNFEDSNRCKITVTSTEGGKVKISKYLETTEIVLIGSEIEVVATADEGYAFTGWYLGDSTEPISNEAVFTFVATKNTTLTAHFTKLSNLTICSAGNGRVSFKDMSGTSRIALNGSEVTVVATPDVDCDFIGWFIGDEETPVSTDAEYTFVVEENITLTAKFSKRPVVTLRSAGHGSVSFKDVYGTSKAYLPGSEVTVIATPDEDCDFIGWFIGDEETPVSTDAEYTFVVEENITLTAKFSKRPVVTLRSAGHGSVSFKDVYGTSKAYLPGSEVTVIATPDEDCDFIGWFIGDEETPVSTDAEYTFVVEENITLTAKFSKRPVVTLRSAGHGSVSFKDVYGTSKAYLPGSEVTVIATPDEDCDFIGWFIGDEETPVSTDAEYTFVVEEDITLIAQFSIPVGEAIDLGLPSGTKWANMNVGASTPEDYGGYYAWGEIEEKENYSWSTYKWCNGSDDTMTKYCTSSSYGTVDNQTVLDPEDDVAHVKWGGSWRMPTLDEQKELLNKCTWTWTTLNGVKGYKVTGPNGNSIFLPAAGYRGGTGVDGRGSGGGYWSSSLYSNSSYRAYYLYFNSGYHDWGNSSRYNGRSVRPVSE